MVTVHDPVCSNDGDCQSSSRPQVDKCLRAVHNALYGSFLPIPSSDLFPLPEPTQEPLPGSIVCLPTPIRLNPTRSRILLQVHNKGDRPIQVGSHYPFLEVNPYLIFDRVKSYGTHLDIPAGTACRFEPGETKTVGLVTIGGRKVLSGGSGLATGAFEEGKREGIKEICEQRGFGCKHQDKVEDGPVPEMNREVVSWYDESQRSKLTPSTHRCSDQQLEIRSGWAIRLSG